MIDFFLFKQVKDALLKKREERIIEEISKYVATADEESGKQLEKILPEVVRKRKGSKDARADISPASKDQK